MFLELSPGSV